LILRKSNIALLFLLLAIGSGAAFAQKKKKPESTSPPVNGSMKSREAEFYFTEAEKYFVLEDYAKAMGYYQKALDILPENATIHYKMAEVLSRSEKPDDLIRASLSIEQALTYERKNKFFYLLAIAIYSDLNRFDRATQLYETLLREVSGTEEYLYELAILYQFSGKPSEAIKIYNRAEEIFGVQETSSLQKQRIYLELEKINEALEEGTKLVKAFPDEEQYTAGLAELLSVTGQKEKAITLLENFRIENKESSGVSILLAGLYLDLGQEAKAQQLLNELFDDPDVEYSSKLMILGTYSRELNNLKAKNSTDTAKEGFVIDLYLKLKNEYANEVNTYIIGGDIYLSLGQYSEAEKEYKQAISLGEVNFEVWQNLLYLLTQRNGFSDMLTYSEKALDYYPNQSMLYFFNGMANLRKNQYREAVASLETGKRLSSSNPSMTAELNALLGDAYNGTKDYVKSNKAYDEALAFNPTNYVVLNNYAYYLALRKEDLEKAEKMSSLLIKNNPDNATFLDTHAWVLYTRQKYKDAKKVMERAIASGEANATHFEHYGDILYKLGETDQAVQQWQKAKELLTSANEVLNKKIANRKLYD
jgi:tetratricopeptide (TPR) repeat protein